MPDVTLCTSHSWAQTRLAHDMLLDFFSSVKEEKVFFVLLIEILLN